MKYIAVLLILFSITTSFAQNTTDIRTSFAVNDTINDAKVIDFAQKLENSYYELEEAFFLNNFDAKSFAEKILLNDDASSLSAEIKMYNTGFENAILEKFDMFPKKINQMIQNDASYDVVNYYYDALDKKYHILFRIFSEEEGLNYHDYQLNYSDEKFKIEDIYIYTTGEYLSDTMRQLYMVNLPKTFVDGVDKNKDQWNNISFIFEYKKLLEEQKYKEAYNLLSNLKGDIKDQKVIYIMKIQIASAINEIYYIEAIDELLKKFPDDPSTQLVAVDYYVMLKDFNSTMAALDALEAATNDVFVEYMRGNLAWEFNDYENAEKAYKFIMKEFPEFEMARMNLLYMYDEAKMIEASLNLLDSFIEKEYYTKEELITFIDEPENELLHLPTHEHYTEWKKKK